MTSALLLLLALADDAAEVTATVTVPAGLESFKGRALEVTLYRYDPKAADRPAQEIDRYDLSPLEHAKGVATVKTLSLGAKAKLDPAKGYYLTLFLLDGKARTHIGECDHSRGFAKVLTGGSPREVNAMFREVKR